MLGAQDWGMGDDGWVELRMNWGWQALVLILVLVLSGHCLVIVCTRVCVCVREIM